MTLHKITLKPFAQNAERRKGIQPAYQGRAVVRLEPYPPILRKTYGRAQPLLAMRILELLTPVTRLSDDEYMKPPVPGELLTVNYRGAGYIPWGFRTTNSLTKKVIADLLQPTTDNATP